MCSHRNLFKLMHPEQRWVIPSKDWKGRLLTLKRGHSFFRNGCSRNASGGINEAHTHTPHAACFAFKNILISLFHRGLNVIDQSGPFKISTSVSISSSNTHTVSFPSGNDCPWVVGGWLVGAVCLSLGLFLMASSPPFSPLPNNANQRMLVSFREWMNKCRTHLLWPLLSAHPPSPLHSSLGR